MPRDGAIPHAGAKSSVEPTLPAVLSRDRDLARDFDINARNIAALTGDISSVRARLFAHIDDCAALLLGAADKSQLSRALDDPDGESLAVMVSDRMRQLYDATISRICGDTDESIALPHIKLPLCRALTRRALEDGAPSFRRRLASDSANGRGGLISYLRNSYADTAYSLLSRLIRNPRVTYSGDFTSVCEDVYYSRADYCILPISDSTDGTLTAFRSLIAKYELHTAAVCSVERSEYNTTRFALLAKSVILLDTPQPARTYLQIGLPNHGSDQVARTLTAAAAYNLTLEKIDTVPISSEYSGTSTYCDITFAEHPDSDVDALLCYLALEAPMAEVLGYYSAL